MNFWRIAVLAWLLPILMGVVIITWIVKSFVEAWPYMLGCVGFVLFLAFCTEILPDWIRKLRQKRG